MGYHLKILPELTPAAPLVNISSANGGEINIGDNVLIGANVVIRASDHNINDLDKNINNSGHVPGKINICNNVWIASNCVILKNVTTFITSISTCVQLV